MDIATLGAAQLHCRYAGCERHGKFESDQLPGQLVPPRPCGRARSGLKICGRLPVDVVVSMVVEAVN